VGSLKTSSIAAEVAPPKLNVTELGWNVTPLHEEDGVTVSDVPAYCGARDTETVVDTVLSM
jgi:hypothetical protein